MREERFAGVRQDHDAPGRPDLDVCVLDLDLRASGVLYHSGKTSSNDIIICFINMRFSVKVTRLESQSVGSSLCIYLWFESMTNPTLNTIPKLVNSIMQP